jgi:hypothetical protein
MIMHPNPMPENPESNPKSDKEETRSLPYSRNGSKRRILPTAPNRYPDDEEKISDGVRDAQGSTREASARLFSKELITPPEAQKMRLFRDLPPEEKTAILKSIGQLMLDNSFQVLIKRDPQQIVKRGAVFHIPEDGKGSGKISLRKLALRIEEASIFLTLTGRESKEFLGFLEITPDKLDLMRKQKKLSDASEEIPRLTEEDPRLMNILEPYIGTGKILHEQLIITQATSGTGDGRGKRLLRTGFDEAKKAGSIFMTTEVLTSPFNNNNSYKFHLETIGYVPIGVSQETVDGRLLTFQFFVIGLTPEAEKLIETALTHTPMPPHRKVQR